VSVHTRVADQRWGSEGSRWRGPGMGMGKGRSARFVYHGMLDGSQESTVQEPGGGGSTTTTTTTTVNEGSWARVRDGRGRPRRLAVYKDSGLRIWDGMGAVVPDRRGAGAALGEQPAARLPSASGSIATAAVRSSEQMQSGPWRWPSPLGMACVSVARPCRDLRGYCPPASDRRVDQLPQISQTARWENVLFT
jgi:hypothetical protein